MLSRDEQKWPGFVAFQTFFQGFCFATKKAIFESREFEKPTTVGFRQGCDTRVIEPKQHFLLYKLFKPSVAKERYLPL